MTHNIISTELIYLFETFLHKILNNAYFVYFRHRIEFFEGIRHKILLFWSIKTIAGTRITPINPYTLRKVLT